MCIRNVGGKGKLTRFKLSWNLQIVKYLLLVDELLGRSCNALDWLGGEVLVLDAMIAEVQRKVSCTQSE